MSNVDMSEYVDVAERLQAFYAKHPEGSLQPLDPEHPFRWEDIDGQRVLVYVAVAYRSPDDPRPGIGTAWEPYPGRTAYTRGSELMVCETSAWGRAIAALGIATRRSIATRQEVAAARARHPADAPSVLDSARESMGLARRAEPASDAQKRAWWARLRQVGVRDEIHARWVTAELLGRTEYVAHLGDLTRAEMSRLLDTSRTDVETAAQATSDLGHPDDEDQADELDAEMSTDPDVDPADLDTHDETPDGPPQRPTLHTDPT